MVNVCSCIFLYRVNACNKMSYNNKAVNLFRKFHKIFKRLTFFLKRLTFYVKTSLVKRLTLVGYGLILMLVNPGNKITVLII